MMSKNTANGRLNGVLPAPINAPSLNNVTASEDHADSRDIELGFGPSPHQHLSPQPHTSLVEGTPYVSLTRYSRSFGSGVTHKQDQGQRAVGEASTSNVNVPRRHNSGPSNLYSENNHLRSHQTVQTDLSAKDIFRRPRTTSPDNFRRSILNKVPEEMESSDLSSSQSRRQQVSVDSQRFYGSVGYGHSPTGIAGERVIAGNLSYDEDNELSEEEEEWLLDEELAKQGLYRGDYKTLLALYTLVPLSSLFAFVSLALIPILAFPSRVDSLYPYPPYLPYPLPEIFTAAALWSLAYLLRDPLYATCIFLASLIPFPSRRFPELIPFLTSSFSAILQSASTLFLRQLAVPILLVPYFSSDHSNLLWPLLYEGIRTPHQHDFPVWQDVAFRRVWWIALGWAMAEAVVGIKQGYENIGLYKDVLVGVRVNATRSKLMAETRLRSIPVDRTPSNGQAADYNSIAPAQRDQNGQWRDTSTNSRTGEAMLSAITPQGRHQSISRSPPDFDLRHYSADELRSSGITAETRPLLSRQMTREGDRLMVENEVERDLEELIMLKNREELEEIYGTPVIHIPVFVSCLHRVNSILSSLGTTLLLTSAYMRSTFAYPASVGPPSTPFKPSNKALHLTLPILLAVHAFLTLMHTPWILPRLGIHTVVYIGLLVSLGLFFGGLGVWEALT